MKDLQLQKILLTLCHRLLVCLFLSMALYVCCLNDVKCVLVPFSYHSGGICMNLGNKTCDRLHHSLLSIVYRRLLRQTTPCQWCWGGNNLILIPIPILQSDNKTEPNLLCQKWSFPLPILRDPSRASQNHRITEAGKDLQD